MIKFLFVFFVLVNTYARSEIAIIDSGVDLNKIDKKYLCGPVINLTERSPDDKTGHGTLMFNIIAKYLNPEKHCIRMYKNTCLGLSAEQRAHSYVYALRMINKSNVKTLVLPLEDVSYFYEERGILGALMDKDVNIFAAAGNSRIKLSKNDCPVFPACLLKGNQNGHIVGSSNDRFNYGEVVTEREVDTMFGERGTSVSVSVAAAKFHKSSGR